MIVLNNKHKLFTVINKKISQIKKQTPQIKKRIPQINKRIPQIKKQTPQKSPPNINQPVLPESIPTFTLLNINERVNFYLGKELLETTININDYNNIITAKQLDIIGDPLYAGRLHKLLTTTHNLHNKFAFLKGDISIPLNILTLCKNRCADNNGSVLLRSLNYNRHWDPYYNKPKDKPYDQKLNQVFWRGTSTGNENRLANRFHLVKRWFNKHTHINVGLSNICQGKHAYAKYVKNSCNITTFLNYKYILSVEGNDKDTGINWKLNSNSLVFMAKPRVTSWLMETTLIPNYHYILLKDDFSDLLDKMRWCNNNPVRCKQIVRNATEFMKQFSNIKKEEEIERTVINKYFTLLNKGVIPHI